MGLKKKITLVVLIASLLLGGFYSRGWAWEEWDKNDPVTDEWNTLDLVLARPAGILAGIAGMGLFIVTLPLTVPSGGVERAAERFVVGPFEYSLGREYPDENM